MFQLLKGQCHRGRERQRAGSDRSGQKGKEDQTFLSFVGHLNVYAPQRYLPGNTDIVEERV